jgi:histidyl-tRNA synthetase
VLARALRAVAPTVVDRTGRSLKAQLRGADRTGARVVVLLGDDELARGEAQVRDLGQGTQAARTWDTVPAAVQAILESQGLG